MSERTAAPGARDPDTTGENINGTPALEAHDIPMTDAPTDQAAPPTQPQPQSQPQPQPQPPPQPYQATTTFSTSAAPSPTPIPAPTARAPTPAPIPPRNGEAATSAAPDQRASSRAASAHPDAAASGSGSGSGSSGGGFTMPSEAAAHGAPVRQYINSKITGVLLEGMKIVAREQPKDPLRALGEFLLQRSRELEGNTS
ncbi:hypothetical protein VTK56DRAFT_9338 [Thermocarpiscus australiensis]